MDGTVLIADDDRTIRTVLTQALSRAGCRVHATGSLVTLKRWVEEGRGDLVISDVVMPDGNGLEALPEIARLRPGLPVIIISAQNNIMTAIQATEAEAFDYLPKPFDLPDLMKRTARGLARKRLRQVASTPENHAEEALPMVGRSLAMQALYRLVARVMNSDLTVLVTGPSGTGKSLITRALHDLSDRRNLPYVIVNSDSFSNPDGPKDLVAKARRGTIVFDEVSDLDLVAQGRLTRLLDGLEVDGPRILATTQADLGGAMRDGKFREDLYFRLCAVAIPVPALRDRVDDIDDLATHFLGLGSQNGQPPRRLTQEANTALRSYQWPGNVRQFENIMQQLLLTGSDPEISLAEIEVVLGGPSGDVGAQDISADTLGAAVGRIIKRYFDRHGGALPPAGLYGRILREVELPLIEIALDATGGNQAKCADLLGLNRNTLRKKLTILEIEVTRRRKLM